MKVISYNLRKHRAATELRELVERHGFTLFVRACKDRHTFTRDQCALGPVDHDIVRWLMGNRLRPGHLETTHGVRIPQDHHPVVIDGEMPFQ